MRPHTCRRTKVLTIRVHHPSPVGGVGHISHEFDRGVVEDYGEVMVRRLLSKFRKSKDLPAEDLPAEDLPGESERDLVREAMDEAISRHRQKSWTGRFLAE